MIEGKKSVARDRSKMNNRARECFKKTLGQKMGGYRNRRHKKKVDLREKRDNFFPKTRKKDRTEEYPETRGKGRT